MMNPQKILIVEDDPGIGQSLLDGLKRHGFDANLCTTGASGVEYAKRSGWISLNLERSADEITLTVSDLGIGIPPEDLPHLFERFHRGRNVSDYAGNGLGLAIVKAIVESHSGKVEAQSDGVGMGSRFVIGFQLLW